VFLASGHEGLGLTLAPITGAIVARALAAGAAPALAPEVELAARRLEPTLGRLGLS
jgi:glycine/D-amino acid oxidase-like deaminating enzyme